MSSTANFIVVEALIRENMSFELLRGYEADKAPAQERRYRPEHILHAYLSDKQGQRLLAISPELYFPRACNPKTTSTGEGEHIFYIPRHPEATQLTIENSGKIIFAGKIGTKPPEIKTLEASTCPEPHTVELKLYPAQPSEVDLDFFLEIKSGRRFPLFADNNGQAYIVDLSAYAGRGEGRIVVRASRNFCSTETYSQYWQLPETKVQGLILAPLDGDEWPSGHHGSFMGNLSNQNGRRIPWDGQQVRWLLNNKPLKQTEAIVHCPPLPPGNYTLKLCYGPDAELLDSVKFRVREKSEEQHRYDALLKTMLNIRKGPILNEAEDLI